MEIAELLQAIRQFDLVLPEFQREYVWEKEQAKQLMVSLYRGYPTGSLLFWKTQNPPDIKHDAVPTDKVGTVQVILDGQQRLTTLFLLMENEIPPYYREAEITNDPRDLYFNLHDGSFQYYQASRMKGDPAWVSVVECFQDGSVNPIVIGREIGEDDEEALELSTLFNDNLNCLRAVRSRTYPIQLVPGDANIDDAIDVFDRVNSLGTKLSDAELALAHICGKWPHARRVMKEKLADLARLHFEFDLGFMVRCLVGVVKGRALYETIHEEPADSLQEGWETLSQVLDYSIGILPAHAHIHSTEDLNTTNVLVPVVVYLARNGGKFSRELEMRRFVHWLYAAHTWSRYTSQVDTRLDHDLSYVVRSDEPCVGLCEAIVDQRGRLDLKAADMEGRGIQHPIFRMAFIAAKGHGAIDWFNGMPLGQTVGERYRLHNHHIFPRSLLYGDGGYDSANHLHSKKVNEIANRAFLTADSNVSLGDTPPSEYLPAIAEQYPGALEKQFVPTDPHLWRLDHYEEFLEARRQLIANAINQFMADTMGDQAPPAPETVQDLIHAGESQRVEFKSSLRWDMRQEQVNKALEQVIVKTIAGFLNSYGGKLVVGVSDDGHVLGIEHDLQTLGRGDNDGYEQKLMQLVENHIGTEFAKYIHTTFEMAGEKQVCVVEVEASARPAYVEAEGERRFYIRAGNTTRPLDAAQAVEYIGMHWES
ncbi:MAG: DUF262 domain-containing protein [Armatimonadota bacterium]|nr:DUF262 domain-containing protein [Armatimonadota bacterium]